MNYATVMAPLMQLDECLHLLVDVIAIKYSLGAICVKIVQGTQL